MLLTQCGPTDMCPRTFLRKTGASERRRLKELISSDACPPAARRRDHMIGWRCLWSQRLITRKPQGAAPSNAAADVDASQVTLSERNRPYARCKAFDQERDWRLMTPSMQPSGAIDEVSALAVDVDARKAMDQRTAGDLLILQIGRAKLARGKRRGQCALRRLDQLGNCRAIRSPPCRDRKPPAGDDVSVNRSRADETAGPTDDER
jgi:hypothetical protein